MFLLIPTFTFAKFDIGVKLGYTASKFNTDYDQISADFRSGFQFGVFGRLGGDLYLQPEVIYSIDGGRLNYNYQNQTVTPTLDQKSIDFCLLAGFSIINGSVMNLNIHGGMFASIFTDKGILEVPGELEQGNFESMYYGAKLGVGADLGNFTFELRYIMGLNDIYKADTGFQEFDMKKTKVELSVGLKLFSF